MSLSAGTRLGPYEVLSPLGAGGMGEVYRARDPRRDRDVAIKVLPESLAGDREALSRFEREAKAVAALNHPNILSLHDFGKEGAVVYAVTELLEGETLRDRLDGGAIPRRRAVDLAVQISKGLAAAHEKGVVHRDLKPENLFLTKDGRAKILDFGLAKVVARETAQTSAPTTPAGTEPGTVMGTVGYMSPEQVLGRNVDERTDIFSFGVVLFEMLTGSRAFKGSSAVETMNAILKEEPPEPGQTGKQISPALDRIVRHCLEKSPESRFHSAGDLAFALESAGETTSSSSSAATGIPIPGRRRLLPLGPALVGGVLVAVVAFLAGLKLWLRPEGTWTGTLLGGPEIAMAPRISPDGHTLAFQAMVNDITQVAVMKPGSGNWQVLTHRLGAGYAGSIAWSADGNRIFFDRTADVPMGVYSVPVLGGDEQMVLEDAASPVPLPDGTLLVVKLNAQRALQLYRFWPDSGRLRELPLTFDNTYWFQLGVFPDGREAVAFGRSTERGAGNQSPHIYAVNLDSGKVRRIETGLPDESTTALATTPDGTSVLVATLAGDMTRVVRVPRKGGHASRSLLTLTETIHELDCAADGSVYIEAMNFRRLIASLPPGGGRATRIALQENTALEFITPLLDGRVVTGQVFAGRRRLMVIQPGKAPVNLVTTSEETSAPMTRVGSGEIAFLVGGEPWRTIAIASLASGRIERRIPFDKGPIGSLDASPDGKTIYCGAGGSIWAIPLTGSRPEGAQDQPRRICSGDSAAADPDGKSLLVQLLEAPKARLLRVPLDGGAPREIALNGPFHLTFDSLNSAEISRDGRLLVPLASLDDWFFVPGLVDLSTGKMTRIATDPLGDVHGIAWMPDGQALVEANELHSSLWKFTPEAK
ncbi:MAG: protein kinase domain-containing protein [Thermoanaerobaculia bacterium]